MQRIRGPNQRNVYHVCMKNCRKYFCRGHFSTQNTLRHVSASRSRILQLFKKYEQTIEYFIPAEAVITSIRFAVISNWRAQVVKGVCNKILKSLYLIGNVFHLDRRMWFWFEKKITNLFLETYTFYHSSPSIVIALCILKNQSLVYFFDIRMTNEVLWFPKKI